MPLTCDMTADCPKPVTHIDDKGNAYCTPHGEQRRSSRPCRKLHPNELAQLQRGEPIERY